MKILQLVRRYSKNHDDDMWITYTWEVKGWVLGREGPLLFCKTRYKAQWCLGLLRKYVTL